jgi:glutamate dehydrogenase (NAD(P)+)
VLDEIGRAVGLPRELGGIPLDELGATGFGLRHAAEVAARHLDLALDGARVVVQGFGAVGLHAARFLAEQGCRLVGAADSRGAVTNPRGLDVAALVEHKRSGKPVTEFPDGEPLSGEDLIAVECEIWIPAARPDVIREDNVDRLAAKLVIPGANIPITPGAEPLLQERGVIYVPDFIANAGGVICAAMEYHDATQGAAFDAIEERIRANTEEVLATARRGGVLPSQAARELSARRVRAAMATRRFAIV